jgi:DNA-binding PadR family transcriptional regulator
MPVVQKPISPVTYHLLLALADRDLHGYALKKTVLEQSDGSIRLGAGTLYAAIRRLESDGVIEESGNRPDPDLDDERRRYYSLTRRGRTLLIAETERLRTAVRLADIRLGLSPTAGQS